MLLMAFARRIKIVHVWFAVMAGAVAVWTFAIAGFLQVTNPTIAMYWVQAYYIAGAVIAYSLLEFSLRFPKKRTVPLFARFVMVGIFVTILTVILTPGGLIEQISLRPDASLTVLLAPLPYALYTFYFILFVGVTTYVFLTSISEARLGRDRRLYGQLLLLTISMALSMIFGAWFNLILPLFGNYDLIWAGPPFAVIFALAALYAVTKQGLLDLRAALARTVVYILLLASLVAIYSIVVFGAIEQFIPRANQGVVGTMVQIATAVFLALTFQPLRRYFDKLTNTLFYRHEYDSNQILEKLRTVASNEVKTAKLVSTSTKILADVLVPEYITLYVQLHGSKWQRYSLDPRMPGEAARDDQEAFVRSSINTLPKVIEVRDISHLPPDTKQLLRGSEAVLVAQLRAQKELVGVLFVGAKQGDALYSDKDIQLLTAAADELALAIQNSLRFSEIDAFNTTLKARIDSATHELRLSNAQLQKLDEAKDEFVSMASHQLRTPLTSVKGYISMVLEGDAGSINDSQKHLLGEAFTSSERMVHLINDFLNVSRLQTGKFIVERRKMDMVKVTAQEVDGLKTTAEAHGLKLGFKAPKRPIIIYADEGKLRQVIMNFIDNAIYYSRPKTSITVQLKSTGDELELRVKDTGIGVPESEQGDLFTKFYRASNARKQRPDGTGVGLYLAKRVIDEHGGSVIFESTEGKGSTFGFRLPLKKLKLEPAAGANELDDQPDH